MTKQHEYVITIDGQDKLNAEWLIYHLRSIMPHTFKHNVHISIDGQEVKEIFNQDGECMI